MVEMGIEGINGDGGEKLKKIKKEKECGCRQVTLALLHCAWEMAFGQGRTA